MTLFSHRLLYRRLLLHGTALSLLVPLSAIEPVEPAQHPLPSVQPTVLESALESPQPPADVIDEPKMQQLMEQDLGPDDNQQPSDVLTLQNAIDTALNRNLGLAITRYSPAVAADQLIISESVFDPVLSSAIRARERLSPQASSVLDGVAPGIQPQTTSQEGVLGVSKKLPTGGTVTAATAINRATTNSANALLNPDFTSEATLSVRQPLLRGFGENVNLAEITKARLFLNQTRLEVRREVLNLIAETEIRYWELAAANARKALFDSNLRLAQNLLDENIERERLGLATRLDVLQAQASLAARSEDVILAQQQVENCEDRLRTILGELNYLTEDRINVAYLPEIDPPVPDFREAVRSALAQDMGTQIQYEIIERKRVDRMVARDQTLPSLDWVAGVGLYGRDGDAGISYERTFRGNGYGWNTGLELSFPWGMRAARAELHATTQEVLRAETQLAQIQQELLLRLREAWRAVVAGKERTATTRASLVLNEESFQRERARYDAGASTFRNVLEAQTDYDNAKVRHLDAMIDLIRATILLSRLDGTILERHGFEWTEIDANTQTLPPEPSPLPLELSSAFKR